MPTEAPTCRHLHTDGRPCGSPALRGEPFCFHHHTARKPMPRRDLDDRCTPQLPAPDDFLAIQRGITARFRDRAQRFEQAKALELEALYAQRHANLQADFEARLAQIEAPYQTEHPTPTQDPIRIPPQQNQDLSPFGEKPEPHLALAG